MPTVAEQLRAARDAHGLTVYEVAEITKIRTDHIRALEDGYYDAFAAPVYIRGFVRAYGGLLRLDLDALMADLDAELRRTEKFQEPPSLMGGRRGVLDVLMLRLSKVKWSVTLPALGVVLVLVGLYLGYCAWQDFRARDPLANLGPGLYQPTATGPEEVLPLPTSPEESQP